MRGENIDILRRSKLSTDPSGQDRAFAGGHSTTRVSGNPERFKFALLKSKCPKNYRT